MSLLAIVVLTYVVSWILFYLFFTFVDRESEIVMEHIPAYILFAPVTFLYIFTCWLIYYKLPVSIHRLVRKWARPDFHVKSFSLQELVSHNLVGKTLVGFASVTDADDHIWYMQKIISASVVNDHQNGDIKIRIYTHNGGLVFANAFEYIYLEKK